MCAVAQRIGSTGTLQMDLALYRLRVKPDDEHVAVTLAGFLFWKKCT
jgi:hypothetical protein